MALRTRVKINNITNLHDARYGAGMTVDLLGFSWKKDSMYVQNPDKLYEIIQWITGPSFVAELDENLLPIPSQYQNFFEYVQTDDETMLERISSQYLKPIILEKTVALPAHLEYLAEIPLENVEMLILKASAPLWNQAWKKSISDLACHIPILLNFNYNASQIAEITQEIPIVGFAIDGSTEIRTGINEIDRLAEILEILEEE
ncbi:MAG: hypothetical protein NZM38_07720 [Cytophagales bacterium]|nr:hypothetical protein [Cytophagales bacterium]MDW8384644.1 hypothetical protein [Flammeovirgaceae bacterium]